MRNTLTLQTPLGPFTLAEEAGELVSARFGKSRADASAPSPVLKEAARQVEAYFAGKRRDFDLPLRAAGTEFQEKVWKALRQIPFGKTLTYGDVARRLRRPGAARAVGGANGRNPLPLLIPCHRVVAGGGRLGGYTGGLHIKKFLLELEGATCGA